MLEHRKARQPEFHGTGDPLAHDVLRTVLTVLILGVVLLIVAVL